MRRVRIHATRAARALLLVAMAVALASCARQRTLQTITGLAQGTTYTLQWWSEGRVDTRALTAAVTAELERLDALLSNYRADPWLERFNATRSVEAQTLPSELITLFDLAVDIHRRSEGCSTSASDPWCGSGASTATSRMFPPPTRSRPRLRAVGFDKSSPSTRSTSERPRQTSKSTWRASAKGIAPATSAQWSRGSGYATICSRSAASSPDAEHGRTEELARRHREPRQSGRPVEGAEPARGSAYRGHH